MTLHTAGSMAAIKQCDVDEEQSSHWAQHVETAVLIIFVQHIASTIWQLVIWYS